MIAADPFLASILADPADDGLRLVYADWLEEQGDCARAEFIRVQCRREALGPPDHYDPKYTCECEQCELRRRERELLLATHPHPVRMTSGPVSNRCAWLRVIPDEVAIKGYAFRRGFVEELHLSWQDWRFHHQALRASCPLQVVRLTTLPDHGLTDPAAVLEDLWPGIEFHLPDATR